MSCHLISSGKSVFEDEEDIKDTPEAQNLIDNADFIISKGQGNFEGLSGCGLNIYYLFLCKCEAFMKRFNVPQFTGIMTKETLYREI